MDNVVPPDFSLSQNYPNPFNPSTTISYQLPETGGVKLEIYNLKGQRVKTLINTNQEAGYHSVIWNGTDTNNRNVASGVYFYRLSNPTKTISKRMLLMK
jgi:flagellar hook assembly protein FlgD